MWKMNPKIMFLILLIASLRVRFTLCYLKKYIIFLVNVHFQKQQRY